MWAKNRLASSCPIVFLFILLVLSNTTSFSASSTLNGTIKKHVVAYFGISEDNIELISSYFNIIDTNFAKADSVEEIKSINPNIIALGYRNIMAMHKDYEDWAEVNTHEDWFVHDEFGHRLKEDNYGWYLMDVGNDGWRNHYANYVKEKLDNSPFDGVFTDDVWVKLYSNRWHVAIVNEKSIVNSDGITVTTQYPLWEGPFYFYKNEIGVWTNPEHTGINYYTGGSFSDHTITLGTPLLPGTPVYVNYSAKDKDLFKPPQEKVDSWYTDMIGMLEEVKATIGDKLLIINTDDRNDFLDIADGVMDESFIHATWHSSDYIYSPTEWKKDIDDMITTLAKGKIFLAQSGIKYEEGLTEKKIKETMLYCFASYLLGMSENSTFYFENPTIGGKPTYYPEWDISLGEPVGEYYLVEEHYSTNPNFIPNPSFERDLDNWIINEQGDEGTPNISNQEFSEGFKSAHFINNNPDKESSISSGYIPVEPNTIYKLSAKFKGKNVVKHSSWWKNLGIWGWFYDENYTLIGESQLSLLDPGEGDFDWVQLSSTKTSPANARYFRIVRLGFSQGATGEGWIDDVRLIKNEPSQDYTIYGRKFTNGLVLVNVGQGSHTIEFDKPYKTLEGEIVNSVNIGPHKGVILENVTNECSELTFNPTSEILANGSNSPITLRQSDTLTLTVSLNNNGITNNADWWLAADTPFGLYFFTFEGWTKDWVPGYQGPLFNLDSFEVLNVPASEFPVGTYTFYFCIDTNMDNNITRDSLYCDSIVVNITE